MRSAWMGCVIGAGLVAALGASSASAQTVSVHVVQVRASNEGGESVDPLLAGLGDRLKRQYPYKNYKRVGSDSESGEVGAVLRFDLTDGRTLTLTLSALDGDQVVMQASVTRGRETVINTSLKVRKGRTVLIGVPLGADKLVLAITPAVK